MLALREKILRLSLSEMHRSDVNLNVSCLMYISLCMYIYIIYM